MYGRDALRRMRERQGQAQKDAANPPSLLEQIPVDAPMDDTTLTVWNGERWVAWDRWLATAPLIRAEQPRETKAEEPKGASTHEAADLPPQSAAEQRGLW
jgi:hypothetical protein